MKKNMSSWKSLHNQDCQQIPWAFWSNSCNIESCDDQISSDSLTSHFPTANKNQLPKRVDDSRSSKTRPVFFTEIHTHLVAMNPVHVGISSESGLWNCKSGYLRVESFCWWFKNPAITSWYGSLFHYLRQVLYIPRWLALGFLSHQQYITMVFRHVSPLVLFGERGFHIVCLKMDVFKTCWC